MLRDLTKMAALFSLSLIAILITGAKLTEPSWRTLPLIKDGKPSADWTLIGYGEMVVDNNSLRTQHDDRGMGLFLYTKERLGNCQIRVVYRSKEPKANAGVFIRIDDGILSRLQEKQAPAQRNAKGELLPESDKAMHNDSDNLVGPWYAVHRGFEVQICDTPDAYHRTGAIYSLAQAAPVPNPNATEWKTMLITLKGTQVLVDVDGRRITTFDSENKDVRSKREWYEPKYDFARPASGYLGLQVHDNAGDVVYFKEVSVRSLE